ncbi:MAG: hypothetical protein WC969_10460 [Elusimicrobiota bacterium]|jgi:uncharacterized protein involved in outer membrane biogenesis
MKKLLLLVLVALIVAAGVVYLRLGAVVKAAVEAAGPRVAGVEVRLASVSISPFSGRGSLRGLFVGNPQGYKTEAAVKVGAVRVAVDLRSLLSDTLVVREVVVEAPEITYEMGPGGSNIARIQKNVEAFSPAAPKESRQAKRSEKKVIVDLFAVREGKVNLSAALLGGKELSIPLPAIELRDIGRKSNGASAKDVFSQVVGEVGRGVGKAVAGGGDLLKGGAKALEGVAGDAGKQAGKLLKGLFK